MNAQKTTYISKYNKEKYNTYLFRVQKNNNVVIDKLNSISNRNKYILDLIENDINPSVLTIKEIKDKIKPVINKYGIKDVYLFGSYARGEANSNSDIDIYCDKGKITTLWQLSAFKNELEDATGKNIDIVTIGSKMSDFFKEQLTEDMIKIC